MERGAADNFQFNTETQFVPILGLVESELNSESGGTKGQRKATSIQEKHHPALLSLLASELFVAPEYIHDFELCVRSIPLLRSLANRSIGICTTHNHRCSAA